MDIEIFALGEGANDNRVGNLNILGALDSFYANIFPMKFLHFAIALRIRFKKVEEGIHEIKINFVDLDGKPFFDKIEHKMDIKIPGNKPSHPFNLIISANDLFFQQPGQYAVDLAIDGQCVRSLPIFVYLLPGNPQKV